jgi:hypothetical protein
MYTFLKSFVNSAMIDFKKQLLSQELTTPLPWYMENAYSTLEFDSGFITHATNFRCAIAKIIFLLITFAIYFPKNHKNF